MITSPQVEFIVLQNTHLRWSANVSSKAAAISCSFFLPTFILAKIPSRPSASPSPLHLDIKGFPVRPHASSSKRRGKGNRRGSGRGTHPAFFSFLFLRYCLARDWPTTREFQGKRAEESANSQLSIFRKRRCVDSVTPFSSEPPTQCHQRCTERWWWPSPSPYFDRARCKLAASNQDWKKEGAKS